MATNKGTEQPIDPAQNFASHLRHRRQLIEMSQVELADAVSELGYPMAQQTVAKIETGKRPVRLDEASALAHAVGMTLPQMLQPPLVLSAGVLRRSLRSARLALTELEQQYGEADEERKAAAAAADEAAARFAEVKRQLALQRDAVDSITQLVDQIGNEKKGA